MIQKIEQNIFKARTSGKIPAFSYERVSSLEQAEQGNSLEYQSTNAAAYAAKSGLTIVYQFSVVESAFKENRATFNQMLDLAIKYNVNDIIFKNTDRLSRNDIDWPRCKKLAKQQNFRIHLYGLNIVFQKFSTAEEEMFLDNTSIMAKYWSNKISQGVRDAYKWKVQKGLPINCPIGYKYNKQNITIDKDKNTKDMLEFIFDTFDNSDIGLSKLTDMLNDTGYKTTHGCSWRKSYLYEVLTNPVYAGFFTYDGIRYEGKYEPYITVDQFNGRLKRLHAKNQSQRKRDYDLPLTSLVYSGQTGRTLTGEIKKGKYVYYSHRRPDVSYSQDHVFSLIDNNIEAIIFSDTYAEMLKLNFKAIVHEKVTAGASQQGYISRKIQQLTLKQNKIFDLYAEDTIDKEAVKIKLDEIRNTINSLINKQKQCNFNSDELLLNIVNCIDNLRDLPTWYAAGSPAEKGDILKTIISKIHVYDDHASLTWNPYYQELINGGAFLPQYKVRKSSFMLPKRDDFRTVLENIIDAIMVNCA